MKEATWEACIAKSTLPEGWSRDYLEIDTWYPIKFMTSTKRGAEILLPAGSAFILQKNCSHLSGGNWKFRKIRKGKEKS